MRARLLLRWTAVCVTLVVSASASANDWLPDFPSTAPLARAFDVGPLLPSSSATDGVGIRAGSLMLHRLGNNNDDLLLFDTGPTVATAPSDALDFSSDTGWELLLFKEFTGGTRVEARYFEVDGLTGGLAVTNGPVGGLGLNTQNAITLGRGSNLAILKQSAELRNIELNIWQPLAPHIRWLAGVRIMENDERLLANITGPNTAIVFDQGFATENHMYGVQLGLLATLIEVDRFRIESTLKGGAYLNDAQTSAVSSAPLVGFGQFGVDGDTDIAFVGEFELAAVYDVTETISLRAAYSLLGMTNQATATNQVNSALRPAAFANPRLGVDAVTSDDAFYQGLSLQIEIRL